MASEYPEVTVIRYHGMPLEPREFWVSAINFYVHDTHESLVSVAQHLADAKSAMRDLLLRERKRKQPPPNHTDCVTHLAGEVLRGSSLHCESHADVVLPKQLPFWLMEETPTGPYFDHAA